PTQATPEPAKPPPGLLPEDLARLETALKARHEEENRRQRLAQDNERTQTASVLDLEIKEKIVHFDALQQAGRDRYLRENKREERTGIAGWFAAVKDFFRPGRAAEEARQRKEAAEVFGRE